MNNDKYQRYKVPDHADNQKIYLIEDTGKKLMNNIKIEPFEGVKPKSDINYMTPFRHPPLSELEIVNKTRNQNVLIAITVLSGIIGVICLICCLRVVFGSLWKTLRISLGEKPTKLETLKKLSDFEPENGSSEAALSVSTDEI